MSGFAVVVRFGGPLDPSLVDAVAAELVFRGPDGEARWRQDDVAMLQTVLVTSAEDPPAALIERPRCVLVGDVRLDDRDGLIRALRGRGLDASAGDPDNRLAALAYEAWGSDCVEHLLGDFAFAVWDAKKRQLFCARDHFGVVPLHYARVGDTLVCGNAVEAVLRWPGVAWEIEPLAVGDYLMFSHVTDPELSFYRGVRRLAPAHALRWDPGGLRVRRYWTPPEPTREAANRDIVESFGDTLARAIADRVGRGPVHVAMSGGMDSTTVAAYARRMTGRPMTGWCIAPERLGQKDEAEPATRAAAAIGIPLRLLAPDDAFLRASAQDAFRWVPEPRFELRRAPGAILPESVLAEGGRVILAGFGGDAAIAFSVRMWAESVLRLRCVRLARDSWRFWRTFRRHPPLHGGFRFLIASRSTPELPPGLAPGFVEEYALRDRYAGHLRKMLTTDPRTGMATLPFWSELLAALDVESTRLPVRFRHPFFDVRVLEFVLRVPEVPWLWRKHLLRECTRGVLPDEVVNRPKAVVERSMYHEAAVRGAEQWLPELVETPGLEAWLDVERLRRLVASPESLSSREYIMQILMPVSLAAWLIRYREKTPDRLPASPC